MRVGGNVARPTEAIRVLAKKQRAEPLYFIENPEKFNRLVMEYLG